MIECWAVKQTFDNGYSYIAHDTLASLRSAAIDKAVLGWCWTGDADEIVKDKRRRTKFWKKLSREYGLSIVRVTVQESSAE